MRAINSHKSFLQGQHGYNLIQLAIAMVVAGVMLAGTLTAYGVYLETKKRQTTQSNLAQAVSRLQDFRTLQGRFPCPADITVPRADPNHGRESPCTLADAASTLSSAHATPLAFGNCLGGVCVERGRTTRPDPATGAAIPIPVLEQRVIVGAIPFRALQMDEEDTIDGYGARYLYAVTQSMTDASTFNETRGVIAVVNEGNQTVVDPPGSVGFVILSPGRNSAGGFSREGALIQACPAAAQGLESDNCNECLANGVCPATDATARYVSSFAQEQTGANFYDDVVNYYAAKEEPVWRRTEELDPDNIEDLSPDNSIGVGVLVPTPGLDITSSGAPESLRVNNLSGGGGAAASLQTSNLCDYSNNFCFNPMAIGGNNTLNVPGEGMKCPAGEYMIGIRNGGPECGPVPVTCSGATPIMTGVNAQGQPICAARPPAGCPTRTVTICGETRTLPVGTAWQQVNLTAGFNRVESWICMANWSGPYPTGICTCTPSSVTSGILQCSGLNSNYTGTYTTTTTTQCLTGPNTVVYNATSTQGTTCNCPARDPQWVANGTCSGFLVPDPVNGPPMKEMVFNNAMAVCNFTASGNTRGGCVCQPPAQTTLYTLSNCAPGKVRSSSADPTVFAAATSPTQGIATVQTFNPNPGVCQYQTTSAVDACVCNTDEENFRFENPTCGDPVCETVATQTKWLQKRDPNSATCAWVDNSIVEQGVCSPKAFKWERQSSSGLRTNNLPPNAALLGEPCTCAEHKGGTKTCYEPSGGEYVSHTCKCQ